MKEIIAQYGNVIIACMVAVAMIGLLSSGKLHGGQSLAGIQGRLMEGQTGDAMQEGNASYDKLYEVGMGTLVCENTSALFAGSRICLDSCFSWQDEPEKRGGFRVLALQEQGGTWCNLERDERQQAIYSFSHEGRYTCWLEKLPSCQIVCCDMVVRPNRLEG